MNSWGVHNPQPPVKGASFIPSSSYLFAFQNSPKAGFLIVLALSRAVDYPWLLWKMYNNHFLCVLSSTVHGTNPVRNRDPWQLGWEWFLEDEGRSQSWEVYFLVIILDDPPWAGGWTGRWVVKGLGISDERLAFPYPKNARQHTS